MSAMLLSYGTERLMAPRPSFIHSGAFWLPHNLPRGGQPIASGQPLSHSEIAVRALVRSFHKNNSLEAIGSASPFLGSVSAPAQPMMARWAPSSHRDPQEIPLTIAQSPSPAILDRACGALLGLAVGDALGTTLEFTERDSQPPHTEMTGGGPFNLAGGDWTDDTAMALALADSLITCQGFDPHDLATRFVSWWQDGRYSCTSSCFDIGITTREALARFVQTQEPYAGSTDPRSAGNGSLMRLSPVALFALHDARLADQLARDQSQVTHGAPQAVEACAFFVQLLRDAIQGQPDVLHPRTWAGDPAIAAIGGGSWRQKSRDDILSSGYVIDTLEAALWAVGTTSSFEDALVLAVNLADDADTVGAVTGQLAGAIYGAATIPERWLHPLAWRTQIAKTAATLLSAYPGQSA